MEAIEVYYLEKASEAVADRAVDAILSEDEKITALDLKFRPSIRAGIRECVMTRFPYTLGYLFRAKACRRSSSSRSCNHEDEVPGMQQGHEAGRIPRRAGRVRRPPTERIPKNRRFAKTEPPF